MRATIACQCTVGTSRRGDIVLPSRSPRKCHYPLFAYPLFKRPQRMLGGICFANTGMGLAEIPCKPSRPLNSGGEHSPPKSRKKLYTPPHPPPLISGQKAFFSGGGGVYILSPHAAGILYAPPFYTPSTPRRVFLGVGGWGCIKFGPVLNLGGGCQKAL